MANQRMPVEVKTAGRLPIILEEYVEYNPI